MFIFLICIGHVWQTRLQAQAAGAAYAHPLSNALSRMAVFGPNMVCVHSQTDLTVQM